MPRLLFTIEYLGTRFSGWQRQSNAPSIQQHVEEALEKTFKQRIILEGAGRTDSGVLAGVAGGQLDLGADASAAPLPGQHQQQHDGQDPRRRALVERGVQDQGVDADDDGPDHQRLATRTTCARCRR